jgi:hypothetical protein
MARRSPTRHLRQGRDRPRAEVPQLVIASPGDVERGRQWRRGLGLELTPGRPTTTTSTARSNPSCDATRNRAQGSRLELGSPADQRRSTNHPSTGRSVCGERSYDQALALGANGMPSRSNCGLPFGLARLLGKTAPIERGARPPSRRLTAVKSPSQKDCVAGTVLIPGGCWCRTWKRHVDPD